MWCVWKAAGTRLWKGRRTTRARKRRRARATERTGREGGTMRGGGAKVVMAREDCTGGIATRTSPQRYITPLHRTPSTERPSPRNALPRTLHSKGSPIAKHPSPHSPPIPLSHLISLPIPSLPLPPHPYPPRDFLRRCARKRRRGRPRVNFGEPGQSHVAWPCPRFSLRLPGCRRHEEPVLSSPSSSRRP